MFMMMQLDWNAFPLGLLKWVKGWEGGILIRTGTTKCYIK